MRVLSRGAGPTSGYPSSKKRVDGIKRRKAHILLTQKRKRRKTSLCFTESTLQKALWGAGAYFESFEYGKAITVLNHLGMSSCVAFYWLSQYFYRPSTPVTIECVIWVGTFFISTCEGFLVWGNDASSHEFQKIDRWVVLLYAFMSFLENGLARYFEVQIIVEDTSKPGYVRNMEKVFRDFIFGYMESYSRWGDRQELVHSYGRPRSRHASSSMAMAASSSMTLRTSQSSGSLPSQSARDYQPSGYSFYRPKNFHRNYSRFVIEANVIAGIINEEESNP
nr:hypothetical protein Iba_chr12bCG1660 [Ipomoea batatas]